MGNKGQFQPGNQLSKGKGRPKMTAEQHLLKVTTRTEVSGIMAKYLTLSAEEVNTHLEDDSLPILDLAILKNLKLMREGGSLERMDWMMDHIMGKQATKVEVKATAGIDLDSLTVEELENLRLISEKGKK